MNSWSIYGHFVVFEGQIKFFYSLQKLQLSLVYGPVSVGSSADFFPLLVLWLTHFPVRLLLPHL